MKRKILSAALLLGNVALMNAQTTNHSQHNLSHTQTKKEMSTTIYYKTVSVDGLNIFYREAGDETKPTILLLHGFPSSSHMYRDLIKDLASNYHLIAPDYPGFGQSSAPSTKDYIYTFDNLTATINHFIDAVGLKKFSLFAQDYGGPVGFRIASQRPELIQALIIQNANAYNEGLGDALSPLVAYIQHPNAETEKAARGFLSLGATRWQYEVGAEDVAKISPDSYLLDQYYLDRPGNDAIQLALFRDYGSNLPLYEKWHAYFKKYQPATLVIWGKNDPLFIAPGAEAYKRDNPSVDVHLLNGGHFLLEEHHHKAAELIIDFLDKKGIR